MGGCMSQQQGSQNEVSVTDSKPDSGEFSATVGDIDRPETINTPDSPSIENNIPGMQDNFKRLYREIIDSVVSIRHSNSEGSGFVYDDSGHIVTNQHVVDDTKNTIYVKFSQGEYRKAKVMGTDIYTDLAVLKVEGVPGYVDPIPVAKENPVQGQIVAAIGTPLTYEGTMTQGIVSGANRSMSTANNFAIPDTVQTDAPINKGNSGGPLVTLDGVVVGVNRAKIGSNIGFAISPELLNKVIPKLIKTGGISHPYLGVKTRTVTPMVAEANNMDKVRGIIVAELVDGGPASGVLQGKTSDTEVDDIKVPVGGDIILSIDGTKINSNEELARTVMVNKKPGDTINLKILRDGKKKTVQITLGERPQPNNSNSP